MKSSYVRSSVLLIFFLMILNGGCSSAPVRHFSLGEEQLRKEIFIGEQLSQRADVYFHLKKSTKLQSYLKNLTHQLLERVSQRSVSEVSVELVDDRNGLWRSFVLPGNRFYISLGLLQSIEYENELMALISIQVSLLQRRVMLQFIESLEQSKNQLTLQRLNWDGILNFSVQDELQAMKEAVGFLYESGYDPRGLVSLLNRYLLNPDHSPYNQKKQELFFEFIRREIAQFPPLRNPILRSDEFIQMKQRISKL